MHFQTISESLDLSKDKKEGEIVREKKHKEVPMPVNSRKLWKKSENLESETLVLITDISIKMTFMIFYSWAPDMRSQEE